MFSSLLPNSAEKFNYVVVFGEWVEFLLSLIAYSQSFKKFKNGFFRVVPTNHIFIMKIIGRSFLLLDR